MQPSVKQIQNVITKISKYTYKNNISDLINKAYYIVRHLSPNRIALFEDINVGY